MWQARRLRELLARPGMISTFAAHDAFTARVMEGAGVEMLFLGGFGVSASRLGLPDVGLLTQTEMAGAIRQIAPCLGIPLVADGDTGFGELHNVVRTVHEFERAGAAGILLEDQVFPKRCGHFAGKGVIPTDEMLQKLKAALDARQDTDFVVVARTDARAVEGFDAAVDRANRYGETGADVCFVEAPQSRDEVQRLPRDVGFPLLANMLVGGATPVVPAAELQRFGYRIAVDPVSSLAATGFAIRKLAAAMLTEGRLDSLAGELLPFDELKRLLRVDEFLGRSEHEAIVDDKIMNGSSSEFRS